MSPLQHPLYIAIFVDVVVTLIVDHSRGQLDFSLQSNLWVHLCNFPIWIILIVFFSCSLLRRFFSLWFVRIFVDYLRLPRHPRPQVNHLHELAQVYEPPTYIRKDPKTPLVEASSVNTTPITPRPRYGFQDV